MTLRGTNRAKYISDSTVLPGIRRIQGSDTASDLQIVEYALPGTSNTEFTVTLPAGARGFRLKSRGTSRFYVSRTSGGDSWFVKGGAVFPDKQMNLPVSGITLYLTSPETGDIIELLYWT